MKALFLPVLATMISSMACQPPSAPVDTQGASPHPTGSTASPPAPKATDASPLSRCRGDKPDPAKPGPKGPRHTWGSIAYPALATPWGLDGKAHPRIGFGENEGGLRVSLSFSGPGFRGQGNELSALPLPKKGELQVFLHTPQGKVLPKCGDDEIGAWAGGSLGTSGNMTTIFPWQPNSLSEAWIEVRLPDISYWLIVPYGFTRDPREPLCPPDPAHERPAPPPVAAEPSRKTKVIPWEAVAYDLGLITSTWRLSLTQSNPFDASTVVTLYKDDNSQGLLSWSLESPKTALRVERGYTVQGILMSVSREEDGFRRTDRFRLNRNPSNDGRFWGTLVITVDGKDFQVTMPSSLFKYTHGAPDLSAFDKAPP